MERLFRGMWMTKIVQFQTIITVIFHFGAKNYSERAHELQKSPILRESCLPFIPKQTCTQPIVQICMYVSEVNKNENKTPPQSKRRRTIK